MRPLIVLLVLAVSLGSVNCKTVWDDDYSVEGEESEDQFKTDTDLTVMLQAEIKQHKNKNEQQDHVIEQQGNVIEQQGHVIDVLKTRLSSLEETVMSNQVHEEHPIQHIGQESQIKAANRNAVAFHAVNDKGQIPNLGLRQHIVFPTVLLNIGGGFHPHHGVFVAPRAGLYIFSSSILSYNGPTTSLFAADIVKNGVFLARLYGHGDNRFHDQGSATVVTQLNAGDEVWVRLACCANDSLYGGRYTSFTGALLN